MRATVIEIKENTTMRPELIMACLLLSACGVETMSTAATSAAIKQREMAEGKKTMEQMQQKIDAAAQQTERRAEQSDAEQK